MKKKWLIGLASLCMAFATVGFIGCGDGGNGDAAGDGAGDGAGNGNGAQGALEYVLSDDGTYYTLKSIGEYKGTDIVIPSDYQGKPVKKVGAHAFNNDDITSVVVGDKVESIGNDAFHDCYDLTSIVIGKSVTEIGERAFMNCEALTGIDVAEDNTAYKDIDGNLYTKDGKTMIKYATGKTATEYVSPEGLETVMEETFSGSDNLTSVTIKCKTIGKSAFSHCVNLARVEIDCESIVQDAFAWCGKLASVTLSKDVTHIEKNAFYDCQTTDVYYKGSVADWCNITFGNSYSNPKTSNGCLYFYNDTKKDYELLEDWLIIPDTVTDIKSYTFERCNIKNLVLGESVTTWGNNAFNGSAIKNVYYKCAKNTAFEDRFFSSVKHFYYSETPNYDGYHWYYQGDVPTIWLNN